MLETMKYHDWMNGCIGFKGKEKKTETTLINQLVHDPLNKLIQQHTKKRNSIIGKSLFSLQITFIDLLKQISIVHCSWFNFSQVVCCTFFLNSTFYSYNYMQHWKFCYKYNQYDQIYLFYMTLWYFCILCSLYSLLYI